MTAGQSWRLNFLTSFDSHLSMDRHFLRVSTARKDGARQEGMMLSIKRTQQKGLCSVYLVFAFYSAV